jgi:glycerophosphoryl diester phosphodiesterase
MWKQPAITGAALPLVLLVLLAAPAAARPAPCATYAAHRGYATASATENGMRAIRAARAAGAPVVELDLARTSDSYVVLMHDKTIDRTTNGTGHVWSRTRSYLRNRVLLNDRSRIPTLGGVLHYAARSGVRLQLELKSTGGSSKVYRRIKSAIQSHGMAGRVTLTSFAPTRLKLAATYVRGVPRALISRARVTPAQVRGAYATRANVRVDNVTTHYVTRMHAAGIKVASWVVDDPAAFQPTTDTGVDSITTDNVPAYRHYCAGSP